MKKITLLLIIICCQFSVSGQIDYKQKSITPGANYYEIVNSTRSYYQQLKTSKSVFAKESQRQEKQFERWAYFWKDRIDANGNFPSEIQGKWLSEPTSNGKIKYVFTN